VQLKEMVIHNDQDLTSEDDKEIYEKNEFKLNDIFMVTFAYSSYL
jgi:hypothetical protein